MVSTASVEATRAAVEILEQGGNAADAAVAGAFALGVADPGGSGLGGMTLLRRRRSGMSRMGPNLFRGRWAEEW